MSEIKNWDSFYQHATEARLKRVTYQTSGSAPFQTIYDGRLKDAISTIVLKDFPSTVLSLGEGHSPRIWTAVDAHIRSNKFDNKEPLTVICIDPAYKYPTPINFYTESFLRMLNEISPKHQDLVRTTSHSFRLTSYPVAINFLPFEIPTSGNETLEIDKAVHENRIWLNIHQLLNYIDWEEFKSYMSIFLNRVDIVSFSNKVDADREVADTWSKNRLKDNNLFIQWLIDNGFRTIWYYQDEFEKQDNGAILIRQ